MRLSLPQSEGSQCLANVTTAQPSDADLLRCMADDDQQAWEMLYDRYWQFLVDHIVKTRSVGLQTAEDVASETLACLWPARQRLVAVRNFPAYIRGIARNLIADGFGRPVPGTLPVDLVSADPSPTAAAENNELVYWVNEAVRLLPESHRKAFEMRQLGLTARQIGAISGCTEKGARRRTQKAVERLRQSLAKWLDVLNRRHPT